MKWNDKENEEKVDIFKILSESLDFFSFFLQEEINYFLLNRILFIIYY